MPIKRRSTAPNPAPPVASSPAPSPAPAPSAPPAPSASSGLVSARALVPRSRALTFRGGSPPAPGVSDALNRSRFAAWAGLSYHGERDLYEVLGYDRQVSITQFRDRYRRNGIARRVVKALPKAAWVAGTYLTEDPDPEVHTEFELAVEELFTRLGIWKRLYRTDVLANLGEYAVLVIGADDSSDPAQPLDHVRGPDSILYLTPYAEDRAKIETLVNNPADPRDGLPLYYTITNAAEQTTHSTRRVHYTRVIHLAIDPLEDDIYGESALEPVHNWFDDLDKLVGGGSEAFYRRADPGLHMDVDAEADMEEADELALDREATEYVHGMSRIIRTMGTKVNLLQTQTANFNTNAEFVLRLISGSKGLPYRLLVGSEMGELASSQDRNNWNDTVAEHRDNVCEPFIRALISRLVDIGALPEPVDYDVTWPVIEEQTETEKAELSASLAEANNTQVTATGEVILTATEIRDRVWGLPPLDDSENPGKPSPQPSPSPSPFGFRAHGAGHAARKGLITYNPTRHYYGRMLSDDAALDVSPGAASPDPHIERKDFLDVHLAAGISERMMYRRMWGYWEAQRQDINLNALTSAIHTGYVEDAINHIEEEIGKANPAFLKACQADLLTIRTRGAQAVIARAKRRGSWTGTGSESRVDVTAIPPIKGAAGLDMGFNPNAPGSTHSDISYLFDGENARSILWAANHSSALVTEIDSETRAALREFIAAGQSDGIPPAVLARDVREVIGLRSDQIRAVSNLADELRSAEPGTTISRFLPRPGVRDVAGFRAKVPKSGATDDWVSAKLAKYSQMQLDYRGMTISRTETINAANTGQSEVWLQARDRGEIDADQRRVWLGTGDERERDEHLELEGALARIDEPFEGPDGDIEPGEEVNCRCGQGLATDEDLARAEAERDSEVSA